MKTQNRKMTANGIFIQNQKINGLNRNLDYLLLDFFEKR